MYTRSITFFENGTKVPFCLSRRNIPELYTKRYKSTVFKKWLGYIPDKFLAGNIVAGDIFFQATEFLIEYGTKVIGISLAGA